MFWVYEIIDNRYFSIAPKNSLPDAKEVVDKLSKRAKDRGYNHTFVVKENGNPEVLYSTDEIKDENRAL
jgi:hypothetical protein